MRWYVDALVVLASLYDDGDIDLNDYVVMLDILRYEANEELFSRVSPAPSNWSAEDHATLRHILHTRPAARNAKKVVDRNILIYLVVVFVVAAVLIGQAIVRIALGTG